MKHLILISSLILVSCHSHSIDIPKHSRAYLSIDTSRYAILNADSVHADQIIDGVHKSTNLSNDELVQVEHFIHRAVAVYNTNVQVSYEKDLKTAKVRHSEGEVYDHKIKGFEKYYKQLITYIDPRNDKIVWVNCFCDIDEFDLRKTWRKSIVLVMDGGNCFFQLKINLTKGTIYDFRVNGVA